MHADVHVESTGVIPGAAAIGILPADGKPQGIRLRGQTVNTVISEDAAGVWADTDVEVRLQNRGNTPVNLPVGLPGPQPSAYVTTSLDLPLILAATLDKVPLTFSPVDYGEKSGIRAAAFITVPVESTVALHVRYRQAVPVRDGLAAYAYPLAAGNAWAGAPESLSFVLSFKAETEAEQIMHLAPGSRVVRPGVYSWSWNGIKAPSNIAAVFITNARWRALEADRAAVAAPGAGLAEHARLAERYWQWATMPPPIFAPAASAYDRAFPLAIAALRAGIANANSAQPAPGDAELALAHERLAGLYLAEGSRAEGAAAQTYFQLAVDELAAAVALNPTDADLAASATALQERLAQAATNRGDSVLAAAHSARLRAIATGHATLSATQDAQQQAAELAAAAVEAGDLAGARSLIETAFGPEVLQHPEGQRPAISQSLLHVRSWPTASGSTRREISLQLIDGAEPGSAAATIQETTAALQRVTPVIAAGNALTLTLTYADSEALLESQHKLAAALPRLPELALLSSALTPRRLAWPEQIGPLTRTAHYEERVDLSPSTAAWAAEAEKLEAAASEVADTNVTEVTATADADTPTAPSAETLDQVRAALWRADARAWRDLVALSRATYTVELHEQGAGPEWLQRRVHEFYHEGSLSREWVIRAGETRQLEAAILGWRYDRVALAAAAAVVLVVLAFVGLALLIR